MAAPDDDHDGEHADYVCVRFQLRQDDDGWPPVASEGVWAVRLGGDLVRLDNIPWFARDVASGDTFRTSTDSHGVLWATDKVAWSGNCTVRVIPFPEGALAESRQAVLDAFARLGVDGEGLQQYGIVALNIPAGADLVAVQRLLRQGVEDGWWDYEEGCIGDAWLSADLLARDTAATSATWSRPGPGPDGRCGKWSPPTPTPASAACCAPRPAAPGAPLLPSERRNTDGTCARVGYDALRAWLAAAAATHLPAWAGRLTPHVLRHYCASQLYLGGVDLISIQETLGHAWIATTIRYVHVHRTRIEEVWIAGQQRAATRLQGLLR